MPVPAVGNLVTPSNFYATSAQGAVLLSWQSSAGASIYYVNRSTNNVTFTNIASTSSVSYNDTSGVVGTVYYYQVQSGNGVVSSLATPSLSGLSLKPGQTTLGNMRLQAQQRCDRVNSNFVTTQEWNTYIDQSRRELYDILIQKFGNDYYIADPYSFTTDGVSNLFALPSNIYKLMRVEVSLNPGDPNSWVTLKKFESIQRNLWNFPNVYTFYGITNLRYRMTGDNLELVPIASSGQVIRLWFSPRPNQLINDTDIVDCISGWEEYVVVDSCIKALTKQESDVSIFLAQKQALIKRIEEAAENRDFGLPETVSDVKRINFAWGEPGDGGGYGGGSF